MYQAPSTCALVVNVLPSLSSLCTMSKHSSRHHSFITYVSPVSVQTSAVTQNALVVGVGVAVDLLDCKKDVPGLAVCLQA